MKKIESQYKLQSEKYEFLKLFMDPETIDIFMDEIKKTAKTCNKCYGMRKKLKKA
jgi:hypothetical protein